MSDTLYQAAATTVWDHVTAGPARRDDGTVRTAIFFCARRTALRRTRLSESSGWRAQAFNSGWQDTAVPAAMTAVAAAAFSAAASGHAAAVVVARPTIQDTGRRPARRCLARAMQLLPPLLPLRCCSKQVVHAPRPRHAARQVVVRPHAAFTGAGLTAARAAWGAAEGLAARGSGSRTTTSPQAAAKPAGRGFRDPP